MIIGSFSDHISLLGFLIYLFIFKVEAVDAISSCSISSNGCVNVYPAVGTSFSLLSLDVLLGVSMHSKLLPRCHEFLILFSFVLYL